MFGTLTFTVTLRDKALKTIINILCKYFGLCICNCHCSLPLFFLSLTYDRRRLWMHFTAEDNKTAVKTSLQLPCEAVEIFQRYIEPYKWTWHVWATADRTECVVTEVWWSGNLVSLLMKWERAHRAKSLTAMLRWENNTSQSCMLTHINAYIHTYACTCKE